MLIYEEPVTSRLWRSFLIPSTGDTVEANRLDEWLRLACGVCLTKE